MLGALLALALAGEPRREWSLPCPRELPSAWHGDVTCVHRDGHCAIGFHVLAEQRTTIQCTLPESLPDLASVDDLRFAYVLAGQVSSLGVQLADAPTALVELLTLERQRPRDEVRVAVGPRTPATRVITFAAEALTDARVELLSPRVTSGKVTIALKCDPAGLQCEVRNRDGAAARVTIDVERSSQRVDVPAYASAELIVTDLDAVAPFARRHVRVLARGAQDELLDDMGIELVGYQALPERPLIVDARRLARLSEDTLSVDRSQLLARCAQWLATPLEVPREGGAWEHHYVCRLDGTTLTTVAKSDHVCATCGAHYHGSPYDQVVVARQHRDLADQCRNLALAFRVTGDPAYGERAAQILFAYAACYRDYQEHDRNGNPGRWAGRALAQTLDESAWLIRLCQGLDLLRGSSVLDGDARRHIAQSLLHPAIAVIRKNDLGIHNIQCWHDSALFLAALEADDHATADAALHGASGLLAQLENGVLADGLWYEQSLAYHFYALAACWPALQAASALGIDVGGDAVSRMVLAPLAVVQPDASFPMLNDGNAISLPWVRDHYEQAYARWPDRRLSVALAGPPRHSQFDSLLYAGDLPNETASLPARSAVLSTSGLVMLRSGGEPQQATTVLIDFGKHGGNHGHLDKLGITCFLHGALAFPEAGSISYGSSLQETWYRRTPAHNTLVIDGLSQQPASGELVRFDERADGVTAQVRCTTAYPGFTLLRTIHVTAQGIVVDLCAALADGVPAGQHTFDWLVRGTGALEVAGTPRELERVPGNGDAYANLVAIRALPEHQTVRARFTGTQIAAHVVVVGASALQPITARAPGQPAATLHDLLMVRSVGSEARFAAVYVGTEPAAAPPDVQVEWVAPERARARVGREIIDVILAR